MKRLLSGNEAVAHGAWEAGVCVAAGYPGTPSTEILESLAKFPHVYAEWAPNEKVALDVAIGAAYAGRRALATMKHVGLNVAADAFMYASMTGAEAGLVIVSAEDPSMHSSQNEQDNRFFAKFARIPCLEPSDSQDAKDLTIVGFDISEQFDTPVLLRMTTRVCHTSTPVVVSPDRREVKPLIDRYPRNPAKYVMVPANARKRHPVIEHRLEDLAHYAETFPWNRVEMRRSDLGIITAGVAYQYAREVFPEASILKLGMSYPLPQKLIREFVDRVERVIVLEELDPFLEDQIRLMGVKLWPETVSYPHTKSIFPLIGELNPAIVRKHAQQAGLLPQTEPNKDAEQPATTSVPAGLKLGGNGHTDLHLPARPPVLCPGCPHRGVFYILHKLKVPVNGDIGCYTLGVVPPLSAIHTTGCMGAGIGVAHGAAVAGDTERHVAVIGDSTFFHTGMPALLNVAYNRSNIITIILDNRTTAMTGHQPNPGSGQTLQGRETQEIEIEPLVRALGIDKVITIDAYEVEEIEKILKRWVKEEGPAVLIAKHACALLPEERQQYVPLRVDPDVCNGCTICFRIGCPAILKSDQLDPKYHRPLAEIDPLQCTGCEICARVCPRDAITFREEALQFLLEA